MTSSGPKMWLWIFCPQMTLHDIPKMSQIGFKDCCHCTDHNFWHFLSFTTWLFNTWPLFLAKMTSGYQNERCSKLPLSKITVNLAPKWPLIRKNHYQIDRYFQPKWPLFKTKWPLFKPKLPFYVVRKLTVILEINGQNDRYLYQCDIFQMFWRNKHANDMLIGYQHNNMPECYVGNRFVML